MKSFHLDLGYGRSLTRTGGFLLALVCVAMISAILVLPNDADPWLVLLTGSSLVPIGVGLFFVGGWLAGQVGFPAMTGRKRARPRTSDPRGDLLKLIDEILVEMSRIEEALEFPSIRIIEQTGEYYLWCRNIDESHYPEYLLETIMYDAGNWKSAYLGPFRSRAQAEKVERQIWDSLEETGF